MKGDFFTLLGSNGSNDEDIWAPIKSDGTDEEITLAIFGFKIGSVWLDERMPNYWSFSLLCAVYKIEIKSKFSR